MDYNPFVESVLNFRNSIFESAFWASVFFWAKVFSFVLSLGLLVATIIVFKKNWPLEHRTQSHVKNLKDEKDKQGKIAVNIWANILKKVEKGTEQDLAFAIIEADKLIDSILKTSGFQGDTMAERLKRLDAHQLKSINELWKAHKIRNEIVHTPDYKLAESTAHDALRGYQRVLEELEVI